MGMDFQQYVELGAIPEMERQAEQLGLSIEDMPKYTGGSWEDYVASVDDWKIQGSQNISQSMVEEGLAQQQELYEDLTRYADPYLATGQRSLEQYAEMAGRVPESAYTYDPTLPGQAQIIPEAGAMPALQLPGQLAQPGAMPTYGGTVGTLAAPGAMPTLDPLGQLAQPGAMPTYYGGTAAAPTAGTLPEFARTTGEAPTPGAMPELAGYEQMYEDPAYQQMVREGQRALETSAAARGMQLSGQTAVGLQQMGQQMATEHAAAFRQQRLAEFEAQRAAQAQDFQQQMQRWGAMTETERSDFATQMAAQQQQFAQEFAGWEGMSNAQRADFAMQMQAQQQEFAQGLGQWEAMSEQERANFIAELGAQGQAFQQELTSFQAMNEEERQAYLTQMQAQEQQWGQELQRYQTLMEAGLGTYAAELGAQQQQFQQGLLGTQAQAALDQAFRQELNQAQLTQLALNQQQRQQVLSELGTLAGLGQATISPQYGLGGVYMGQIGQGYGQMSDLQMQTLQMQLAAQMGRQQTQAQTTSGLLGLGGAVAGSPGFWNLF